MTKQDLLNEAARQYKAFHETIHGPNEEHMAEVWLGASSKARPRGRSWTATAPTTTRSTPTR